MAAFRREGRRLAPLVTPRPIAALRSSLNAEYGLPRFTISDLFLFLLYFGWMLWRFFFVLLHYFEVRSVARKMRQKENSLESWTLRATQIHGNEGFFPFFQSIPISSNEYEELNSHVKNKWTFFFLSISCKIRFSKSTCTSIWSCW